MEQSLSPIAYRNILRQLQETILRASNNASALVGADNDGQAVRSIDHVRACAERMILTCNQLYGILEKTSPDLEDVGATRDFN